MGRFTKRVVLGLAAALTVLAAGAFANFTIDDLEGGSNEHKMGNYWYYWVSDDGLIGSTITPTVPYDYILKSAGPGDSYGKWSFKPTVSEDANHTTGGGGGAALVYEHLDYADKFLTDKIEEWTNSGVLTDADEPPASLYAVIGMGMLLTDSDDVGFGSEFKDVDTIAFWMRGTTGIIPIFKVETIENSFTGPYKPAKDTPPYRPNPANAYAIKFDGKTAATTVTTAWKEFKVALKPVTNITLTAGADIKGTGSGGKAGDLAQFAWWGKAFNFDPANATKIAWQINHEDNNKLPAGELYVDDIRLIGKFTYVPKDECQGCTGGALSSPNFKVSDFEDANDPLQNTLGYYWYPYTDSRARVDGSTPTNVDAPWTVNQHTGEDNLDVAGNGKGGGNGIKIEYTMGKGFNDKNGTALTPFAGIGVNLFNDATLDNYANVSQATGIYFDYKTSFGTGTFLRVEFSDFKDIEFAGVEGDNDDGQEFYTKIPGSTDWQSAIITFDKLVLPKWLKTGDRRYGTTLDKSRIGKVQFKYEGVTNGNIAIDNLHFLGIDKIGDKQGVRNLASSKVNASGLRATYSRGNVGVNWNTASAVASGKVQLVNVRGRVVASAPISRAVGGVTANLGAGNIPTGMYFVRMNAKDVNGKKIVQQAPISIVK